MKDQKTQETPERADIPCRCLLDAADVREKFQRYRTIIAIREALANARGGWSGIAVRDDTAAKQWQSFSEEVERIEAFFESREPIPETWGGSSNI